MEFSKKFVFAILALLALSTFASARLRFRHHSTKRVSHSKLKTLTKSKQGGDFCSGHCLAVFIYPSTAPVYINKAEIPLEDDNSCAINRFQNPGVPLKLSESVKVRYPDIFKGVYPGRPYESGENYQVLKAQYDTYIQDLHLLYATSDLDGIAKCYFGGTKEPVDPCSYTKVCGASFGGASCVKFEGHCHSTCSACCFLSAVADTIKDTEEFEEVAEEEPAPVITDEPIHPEEDLPYSPADSSIAVKKYIDDETGLDLGAGAAGLDGINSHQKKKAKHALSKSRSRSSSHPIHSSHHSASKSLHKSHKKASLAHRRAHKSKSHIRQEEAAAPEAEPTQKSESPALPADTENVVDNVNKDVVGGGDPPGHKAEKEEIVATKAEVEQAAAEAPKHGLGFRADPALHGSPIYNDKCEQVQHTQNCRDGLCDSAPLKKPKEGNEGPKVTKEETAQHVVEKAAAAPASAAEGEAKAEVAAAEAQRKHKKRRRRK